MNLKEKPMEMLKQALSPEALKRAREVFADEDKREAAFNHSIGKLEEERDGRNRAEKRKLKALSRRIRRRGLVIT